MLKTLALGLALSYCVVFPAVAIANTISETARQISVRVLSDPGIGSGVIVHHKLSTYTVLTNDHVAADTRDQIHFIVTHDGVKHPARRIYPKDFGSLDVALLQFQSNTGYQVTTFANIRNLYIGEVIYAAGFPNWNRSLDKGLEDTRDWQLSKAFKLTNGNVESILKISLHRGYQIGYSNEVDNGMSGGALLNESGDLVGINGKGKFPFNGIHSYLFEDGTRPSVKRFRQMEPLSWAIPISHIQPILGRL